MYELVRLQAKSRGAKTSSRAYRASVPQETKVRVLRASSEGGCKDSTSEWREAHDFTVKITLRRHRDFGATLLVMSLERVCEVRVVKIRPEYRGNASGALWDVAVELMRDLEAVDPKTALTMVKARVRLKLVERGVSLEDDHAD